MLLIVRFLVVSFDLSKIKFNNYLVDIGQIRVLESFEITQSTWKNHITQKCIKGFYGKIEYTGEDSPDQTFDCLITHYHSYCGKFEIEKFITNHEFFFADGKVQFLGKFLIFIIYSKMFSIYRRI